MKLTPQQKGALQVMSMGTCLQVGDNIVDARVMNNLFDKGLVKYPRYANGEFWELTDKGLEQIKINRL
jgi:hypothetical protein